MPESVRALLERFRPPVSVRTYGTVFTDTTEFMNIGYGDVIAVGGRHYLVMGDEKERRFGMEDPKFWVKRCVELESGLYRILKLEFQESFDQHIGALTITCHRSAVKEARILRLVAGDPSFMQGAGVKDERGNLVRVLERVAGRRLDLNIEDLHLDHRQYFHEVFPGILERFLAACRAISFLHGHGETHGDIRRDHLYVDHKTGDYCWIDFDYGYDSVENPFGLDLFGLGNILCFITGQGVHTIQDLDTGALGLTEADCALFFRHRVVNLRKLFPYVPEDLNRVLMHYSAESEVYYESVPELLADLEPCLDHLRRA
ncbi:MAG: serine/threonine protein kinase [Proteobacteria bacterium]|nr:serine/threonine protein kinase [Pseudomonadota bacterium]MBU1595115.1 serine/threonine protein kinase [Pseudomonadota bacterium]